jgi:UDP-N-acetylmuramoyl-L-alanyl-D-glutamate--2,6-diaminopimelate ligase
VKRLSELTRSVPCTIHGNADVDIKGIAYHSARVEPGFLFVAIDGFRVSGARFIEDAISRGAVAVATTDLGNVHKNWVTAVATQSPRKLLAQVSNRFYGFPARKLKLVGITGTNGKTTTGYLVRAIARHIGVEPGFIGTVEYWDGVERRPAGQTTPESLELVQMLARMADHDVRVCVTEVSSHALELDRVLDLDFAVAAFTNLSQDHLDFHRTFQRYQEAKLKLFTGLSPTSVAVVNTDDPVGLEILDRSRARPLTYGTRSDLKLVPDITGTVAEVTPDGLVADLVFRDRHWPAKLQLVGQHNLMNLMAAFGIGVALGWEPAAIISGAETLENVPGRLERIAGDVAYRVFVDYAHTPDALDRVLSTVRDFTRGRVIVVFGCGGDRDRAKRPLMGEVVARRADLAIVTSDNPRSEDPQAIIREVLTGMNGADEPVVEPDRAEAIRRALSVAGDGDTVVVAGKGHEDYQIVGNERRHFDDRETVRRLMGHGD